MKSSTKTIGSIPVWGEFILNGRVFMRVDSLFVGLPRQAGVKIYRIDRLPSAMFDGEKIYSHQNVIIVQCGDDGAIYFAECGWICQAIDDWGDVVPPRAEL